MNISEPLGSGWFENKFPDAGGRTACSERSRTVDGGLRTEDGRRRTACSERRRTVDGGRSRLKSEGGVNVFYHLLMGSLPPSPTSAAKAMEVRRLWRTKEEVRDLKPTVERGWPAEGKMAIAANQ